LTCIHVKLLNITFFDLRLKSQGPIFVKCFTASVKTAAWKVKPSYGVVPTEDRAINPDILRNMYKRSGTNITELSGSHLIFISKPVPVANVILAAAEGTVNK